MAEKPVFKGGKWLFVDKGGGNMVPAFAEDPCDCCYDNFCTACDTEGVPTTITVTLSGIVALPNGTWRHVDGLFVPIKYANLSSIPFLDFNGSYEVPFLALGSGQPCLWRDVFRIGTLTAGTQSVGIDMQIDVWIGNGPVVPNVAIEFSYEHLGECQASTTTGWGPGDGTALDLYSVASGWPATTVWNQIRRTGPGCGGSNVDVVTLATNWTAAALSFGSEEEYDEQCVAALTADYTRSPVTNEYVLFSIGELDEECDGVSTTEERWFSDNCGTGSFGEPIGTTAALEPINQSVPVLSYLGADTTNMAVAVAI